MAVVAGTGMDQGGALVGHTGGNTMDRSSDEIRRDIERDRQAAGEKIDLLEQQLQDTAGQVKEQAQETVSELRGEAQALVHDTVDAVRENLNIQEMVQEHPLPAVAAALVGGYLLGTMLDADGGDGHSGGSIGGGIRNAARDSGLDETLQNLAAALIGSVTEQVQGAVKTTQQA